MRRLRHSKLVQPARDTLTSGSNTVLNRYASGFWNVGLVSNINCIWKLVRNAIFGLYSRPTGAEPLGLGPVIGILGTSPVILKYAKV